MRDSSPITDLDILARESFLARYENGTLALYALDIRLFFEWCADQGISPLSAKRPHLEAFGTYLGTVRGNRPRSVARRLGTIRTFFRLAHADDLIDRDPTVMMRMPTDPTPVDAPWLNRFEMGSLLRAAQKRTPNHEALVALMGMMGLRVSEACNVMIEDYQTEENGYRQLRLVGKGGVPATLPVPVPALRIFERCRGNRTTGPLILTHAGKQQTRHGARDWIKRLAKAAGLPPEIRPHSLRHGAISIVLDATGDIRKAQKVARHRDIRTTERYLHDDNADTHGVHVAAQLFSSAA